MPSSSPTWRSTVPSRGCGCVMGIGSARCSEGFPVYLSQFSFSVLLRPPDLSCFWQFVPAFLLLRALGFQCGNALPSVQSPLNRGTKRATLLHAAHSARVPWSMSWLITITKTGTHPFLYPPPPHFFYRFLRGQFLII